jgi:hypothetical protein
VQKPNISDHLPTYLASKASHARNQEKQATQLAIFLSLLFNPEDGNHMFLQNTGLFPHNMALQTIKPYSS